MNKVMANKAKTAKAANKKLPKEVSVEAAAEAKLLAENADHSLGRFSTTLADASQESSGGSAGAAAGGSSGGISPVVILGGLAAAGGIAAAAAGGGSDTPAPAPAPAPAPTPPPPPPPAPTYKVEANKTSVDEGSTVTFTITGTNAVGNEISYTLAGTAANAGDLDSPLTGTVKLDANGKATVIVTVKNDNLTEGAETLNLVLSGGQKVAADIVVNDTSLTPAVQAKTFTLTTGIDEGAAFLGTEKGDTYNATPSTLTALDSIDGGAGVDTLRMVSTASITAAPPANATLKSIENFVAVSTGTIGVNAVAASGGSPAAAQVIQITATAASSSSNTVTVYYGALSQVVTLAANSGNGQNFVSGANTNATRIANAINAMAGSAIATTANAVVTVTGPASGAPLPVIAFDSYTNTADAVTVTVVNEGAAAVAPSGAVSAVAYDISPYTDVVSYTGTSVGGTNVKGAAAQSLNVTNTGGGAVTLAGGLDQTVNQASGAVTVSITDCP